MSLSVEIDIVFLPHFQGLAPPAYETEHAAGMDLRYAGAKPLILEPGEWLTAPTGIKIAIPAGYEGQVRPRSGLAVKRGIGLINSPGTIDADYRGEILVPLINFGHAIVSLERGTRIAQLVIAPVARAVWRPVEALNSSARGEGGFGHTGLE